MSAIQKLLKTEPDRAMQEAKYKRFQDDHTLLNISTFTIKNYTTHLVERPLTRRS